jgi:cell division protein FtsI (penicillin-binding protein 3)
VDHEHGGYFSNRYIASFIGFFPAENPRTVLLVMIDDPRGEHFGGSVAGPIFKHIVEEMRLLRPTEYSAPQQSTPPPAPPVEMVVNLGTARGNREEPQKSRPAAYLPQAAAATVEYRVTAGADTTLVAVPALEGWPLRLALQELSRRNLSFRMFGSRTVVTQFPPAGTLVPAGTVCELHGITG